jgi:SAM-dependent methyltransferase
MVSPARWKTAQQYERGYWETLAARIADGSVSQLDWYRWRAEQLANRLRALGLGTLADGSARVIEVGSGPVGVVGFFPAAQRVAVDPLESYYGSNPTLAALRNGAVEYREGSVEALPAASREFDLAIIENCIDHVRDVHGGMRELKRVLRPGGTLYLTVNCRSSWGFVAHRALSRLRIDAGHPHTFTPRRVRTLLNKHGFTPLQLEIGSYAAARHEDLVATDRRTRIKGLIGISEFIVSVIAQPAQPTSNG